MSQLIRRRQGRQGFITPGGLFLSVNLDKVTSMFGINGIHSQRHAPGRAAGILESRPLDGGPAVQRDTVQCVHCGYTSVWVAGSEKWWDWCGRCNGYRCGRVACQVRGCVPKERELDQLEKLVDWNQISSDMGPVLVNVPVEPPRQSSPFKPVDPAHRGDGMVMVLDKVSGEMVPGEGTSLFASGE